MKTDPVIGISGRRTGSGSVDAMMKKISAGGGKPLFIEHHEEHTPEQDIVRIQALVLMGNDLDIDPSYYIDHYPEGDTRRAVHPKTKSEFTCPDGKKRAEYEEKILRLALRKKMPVLGVCGGMHRINVYCGGTLHQHVPDLVGHDRLHQINHGIAPQMATLPIIIQGSTKMAIIARDIKMAFAISQAPDTPKVVMENTIRHQSVEILGRGLITCCQSDAVRFADGSAKYLVEAIEADPNGPYGEQFLVGVQWHPEFGASPLGDKIIASLIDAGREFGVQLKKPPK